MNRRTIQQTAVVKGVGLHTGTPATVRLHPAEAGTGIVFRVRNRQGRALIPALVPSVVETRRRVVLAKDGVAVQTVEHFLAACFGLGVTDILAEVDGEELPAGDGSAQGWVEAMTAVGTVSLQEPVQFYAPLEPLVVHHGRARIEVQPCDRFTAHFVLLTDHPLVGVQVAGFDEATDDFVAEVAPARTFGFWEEVQTLWEQGLAKGGRLDNAIVVFPDHYSVPLRFPNELARHKLLDLMGDLMLLGTRLKAQVFAYASGHTLHFHLCQSIWQRLPLEEATA